MREQLGFEPWTVDDEHKGQCAYFNVSSGMVVTSACKLEHSGICVVCEMDQERLIFTWKSDQDSCGDVNPVKQFVLSQDYSKNIQFSDLSSSNVIQKISNVELWMRRGKHVQSDYNSVAESLPMGLRKWSVEPSTCARVNATLVKLSNVRSTF